MENEALSKAIQNADERNLFMLEMSLMSLDRQIEAVEYHIKKCARQESIVSLIDILFYYRERVPIGYYPKVIKYLNLCNEFLIKNER